MRTLQNETARTARPDVLDGFAVSVEHSADNADCSSRATKRPADESRSPTRTMKPRVSADAHAARPRGGASLQSDALAAVNAVAVSLDQFDTVQDLLVYALDRVLEVVGTEAGSVYLLNEAQTEL